MICYHLYVETKKKKKRIKMNLFDRLTGFENLWSPKDRLGGRDGLRVWNGNTLKLGSDDGCSTINIIKFTELKNFIKGLYRATSGLQIQLPRRPCFAVGTTWGR